ncbi:PTS sugar transporter subunit IIA [Helcococcus kunzii]|uniref:PTS sugar transporter subunit IIA n=1 Tax=Helcococcus kunzii TaxID=40091 RepID=UPI001C944A41|nr:PTS sugar transporter subunit IIA [Helcococcus kunzii]MCT1796866.1 PTS sugar transporter subunit IIA [Helcococcus kunzii]MCT1989702.1 PTS sugar transporter subunit IIA [Helcococcus kunzii]QZO76224.1 PTS sugar transporter subunit IIA [Helcococcus kunzii]
MKKSMIEIDVEVKDKREAVERAGKILYENGYVEKEYIPAMIKTLEEFGPYIVITKGVALPHARPEEGALKSGICVVRLKESIKFGNLDNDPVEILIGLSSLGNDEHLRNIQIVLSILENEQNMSILKFGSVEEIYNIFERRGKNV